jgi:serine protease Do
MRRILGLVLLCLLFTQIDRVDLGHSCCPQHDESSISMTKPANVEPVEVCPHCEAAALENSCWDLNCQDVTQEKAEEQASVTGDESQGETEETEEGGDQQPPQPRIPNSVALEDLQLRNLLGRKGGNLIDTNETVPSETLIEQCERATCELTLPEPTPIANGPVEVYANANASVVMVGGLFKCDHCDNWHANSASGFVITDQGHVVTNHHVVSNTGVESLVVMTRDGRVSPVLEVLAANKGDDVAILRTNLEGVRPLPIAPAAEAAPVGSAVHAISHPDGRHYYFSSGVMARQGKVTGPDRPVDAVWITADYARGSSGAPILNDLGQVVAVVRSTSSVYYSTKEGVQRDLQMVFKMCSPTENILRLIETPEAGE